MFTLFLNYMKFCENISNEMKTILNNENIKLENRVEISKAYCECIAVCFYKHRSEPTNLKIFLHSLLKKSIYEIVEFSPDIDGKELYDFLMYKCEHLDTVLRKKKDIIEYCVFVKQRVLNIY